MPSAWGVAMTRHPGTGAAERRPALRVNFHTSRQLEKTRRSGARLSCRIKGKCPLFERPALYPAAWGKPAKSVAGSNEVL
jgi:hypothetical protein